MDASKYQLLAPKSLKTIGIVVGSMTLAFVLGIESAGDVRTVQSTEANDQSLVGDFSGNGILDAEDARIALDIAQGLRSPTPDELSRDPNRDFAITFEDVEMILKAISEQATR